LVWLSGGLTLWGLLRPTIRLAAGFLGVAIAKLKRATDSGAVIHEIKYPTIRLAGDPLRAALVVKQFHNASAHDLLWVLLRV
jgi:hypothetical protein